VVEMMDFHIVISDAESCSAFSLVQQKLGHLQEQLKGKRKQIVITGTDQKLIAASAVYLLSEGH
jgi:hypothetical protein